MLETVLDGIGTPAVDWLTDPTVFEGTPADAVPHDLGLLLYFHHVRTEVLGAEQGTAEHRHRAFFHVYCVSPDTGTGPRDVLALKADVLRAIFAAEGTFTSAFGQPMYPLGYGYRDDMAGAGLSVGVQEFALDMEISHTAP